MIAELFVPSAAPPIGSDLDRALAPLDDLFLASELPTQQDAERAYVLGMLAADLTTHAPSCHLLAVCQHYGWEMDEALTIGRALASLITRIAQRAGASVE